MWVKTSCQCCGHGTADSYGDYYACLLCKPKRTEKVVEGYINVGGGKCRKARYKEISERCPGIANCDGRHYSTKVGRVMEWLEEAPNGY